MSRRIQYTIPVLDSSSCDDFPSSKFEVAAKALPISEDKKFFVFELNGLLCCPTLEKLVMEDIASIFVQVRSKGTRYRKMERVEWHYTTQHEGTAFSGVLTVERNLLAGDLEGSVVIIAKEEISNYSPPEADSDFFSGEAFCVPVGFLLGRVELKKIILDDEDSQITGTDIMRIVINPAATRSMSVTYTEDVIRIELAESEANKRYALQANVGKTLRAVICFPVLVGALSRLRKEEEEEWMWVGVLREKLDLLGVGDIEDEDLVGIADRLLGDVCAGALEELDLYFGRKEKQE